MLFCQRSVFTELAIVFSDSFILIYLKYKLEYKSNWGLAIFGLEPAFLHFIRNSWIAVHHLACLSLGWHSLRHVRGACLCVVNCVSLDLHWLLIDWYWLIFDFSCLVGSNGGTARLGNCPFCLGLGCSVNLLGYEDQVTSVTNTAKVEVKFYVPTCRMNEAIPLSPIVRVLQRMYCDLLYVQCFSFGLELFFSCFFMFFSHRNDKHGI